MSDTTAPEARRTFAVIDGNSLMHRAFHAVPPTMNAPDGRPTNAVFGFLMFLKMSVSPDGVAVFEPAPARAHGDAFHSTRRSATYGRTCASSSPW